MASFTLADTIIALQIGDDYINPTGQIASARPEFRAVLAEFQHIGEEFPTYVLTGYEGSLSLSGILLDSDDDNAKTLYEHGADTANRRAAFFAFMIPSENTMGPCGYIRMSDQNIVDSDGVFVLDEGNVAVPDDGFERWLGGDVPNITYGTSRRGGTNTWPEAKANQLAVINVVKSGNLTNLRLRYSRNGRNYDLQARKKSGAVVKALSVGFLKQSGNNVRSADAGAGNWLVTPTPSNPSGAEVYIGVF